MKSRSPECSAIPTSANIPMSNIMTSRSMTDAASSSPTSPRRSVAAAQSIITDQNGTFGNLPLSTVPARSMTRTTSPESVFSVNIFPIGPNGA